MIHCCMRKKFITSYHEIISIENLLLAWKEFQNGKRNKKDVLIFERNLMGNIFELHNDLASRKYKHSPYEAFTVSDPKPRNIHKASVRDRVVHRAIYRKLYPWFDRNFIPDSFSCRIGKGTHRAGRRFSRFIYKVGQNNHCNVWVLKCDIRKFFANIDHNVLKEILKRDVEDKNVLNLLFCIVDSFNSGRVGVGLPLGNLTSQLLVNIYMNEFDWFVKTELRCKHYIRYADDFVVLSNDRKILEDVLQTMSEFLLKKLKLELHPDKVFIKTLSSGVDFLGWVHFFDHCVLRTSTKNRMFRIIDEANRKPEVLQSYLGLLSHGNAYVLQIELQKLFPDPLNML